MDSELLRQSGRTAKAIQSAPHGAIYVWHQSDTFYATRLAGALGRGDLCVTSVSWLNGGRFRGVRDRSIVIDHHARQLISYDAWLSLQAWATLPGCEVIS